MLMNKNNLLRLLSVSVLVLISGIAAIQFCAPQLIPTYEYAEENVRSQLTLMTFMNGSVSSFYNEDFEEVSPGRYNLTLPTMSIQRNVELNESVSGIRLRIGYHYEVPMREGDSEPDIVVIRDGYAFTISNSYASLEYSTNLAESYIGTAAAYAMTRNDDLTVDREAVLSFNASAIQVACEFTSGIAALDSEGYQIDAKNFTVLFSYSYEVFLEYQYPTGEVFQLTVGYTVLAISVMVIVVFYNLKKQAP